MFNTGSRTPFVPFRNVNSNRWKHKNASTFPLRLAPVRTPKNVFLLVVIMISALVWSQQIGVSGLFGALGVSVSTLSTPNNEFSHGPVRVDHLIPYDGKSVSEGSVFGDAVAHVNAEGTSTILDAAKVADQVASADVVMDSSEERTPHRADHYNEKHDAEQVRDVSKDDVRDDMPQGKILSEGREELQGDVGDAGNDKVKETVKEEVREQVEEVKMQETSQGLKSGVESKLNDEVKQDKSDGGTGSSAHQVNRDKEGKDGKADEMSRGLDKQSNNDLTNAVSKQNQENVAVTEPKDGATVNNPRWSELLGFTKNTAINFMHFHKTGGVSFKTSLHKFYFGRQKGNGDKVVVRDACYARENVKNDPSQPTFLLWRCDWDPIREMDEEERNKHDFVFGHQFWRNGAGDLLNKRDLRTFTVLRHPFDRKVSFYYHFFVRELGRKESDVTFDEIRNFLLYDKTVTPGAELGRDLGPNYMAGRLLSDGKKGYVGDNKFSYYAVDRLKTRDVAEEALQLIRNYVFVGLQTESSASKCMLRKVVEAFNDVNDVDNEGVGLIDKDAEVLNSGSYALDAKAVWGRLTDEERAIFESKERVDILIYAEGERLFLEHVRKFHCAHRLRKDTKSL